MLAEKMHKYYSISIKVKDGQKVKVGQTWTK